MKTNKRKQIYYFLTLKKMTLNLNVPAVGVPEEIQALQEERTDLLDRPIFGNEEVWQSLQDDLGEAELRAAEARGGLVFDTITAVEGITDDGHNGETIIH